MGKKDSKSRVFFSDSNRFADLINGICFGGEEILRAEDLSDVDPHPGDRTRDVVKLASFGVGFAIIGEESQETVDYSLPVRILESDLRDYKRQTRRIQKEIRERIKGKDPEMEALTPGERLYRYRKDDKIIPVITIVLSNAETWDGPRDLTDMLETEHVPEALIPYISGYRMNIVELPKLTQEITGRFRTDVRQVMDIFRCLRDPQAMRELFNHEDGYRELDEETYQYIREYTNLKRYGISFHMDNQEGGKTRMVKDAFDMIIEEEREDERKKADEKSRKNLREIAQKFLRKGDDPETVSECTGIPLEEVLEIEAGILQKA